jgi:ribosome maturation factor RimP
VSRRAEARCDTNFHLELKSVGLEREAFLYAFDWAGAAGAKAEIDMVQSIIDGQGVEANPEAAIALACGSRSMSKNIRNQLVTIANLRLASRNFEPIKCGR